MTHMKGRRLTALLMALAACLQLTGCSSDLSWMEDMIKEMISDNASTDVEEQGQAEENTSFSGESNEMRDESAPENELGQETKPRVAQGTYVTRLSASSLTSDAELICRATEGTENGFVLHLELFTGETLYELEPVQCIVSGDGSFSSDYAVTAEGYPFRNWENCEEAYVKISGVVEEGGDALTITDVARYSADYDGSMDPVTFTSMSLDGSLFWIGYFVNTSGYVMDAELFDQTAKRIPGSENYQEGEEVLDAIDGGLYVFTSYSNMIQCNVSNVTENGFDLDLGAQIDEEIMALESVTCIYDPEYTYVPQQGELQPFYSELTTLMPAYITDENRDYWECRRYMVKGYLDPNCALLYVTVLEFLVQEDGSVVINEAVDSQSWMQFFLGEESGYYHPWPTFRRVLSSES